MDINFRTKGGRYMANSRAVKGDYIGFTFNGVHSSELGLVRVSNGSRYETDLLPPLQDKTVQVAGRDGAVYFNSQYNAKPIKVPIAFDNLTEEGFNKLRRLLANKKPTYLWFDETPYKQWLVKSANAQNLKWVCFDETRNGKEARIYKGEGTLEFTCFSPYAESRTLFLDDKISDVWVWEYQDGRKKRLVKAAEEQIVANDVPIDIRKTLKDYYNFDEWYIASRLREKKINEYINYNQCMTVNNGYGMMVYNAGDVPIDIFIKILFKDISQVSKDTVTITLSNFNINSGEEESLSEMKIKFTNPINNDAGVVIDSKLKIIKGVNESGKPTGTNYNKNKTKGDFFKIPVNENENECFLITIDEKIPFTVEYKHHYI